MSTLPPPLESMPAVQASPWAPGSDSYSFVEDLTTVVPGAGDRSGAYSPNGQDLSTGTYACVVFPSSGWNPQKGFHPCWDSELIWPSCNLEVPPASAGGDSAKPWITCTDGRTPGEGNNGAWALSQLQEFAPFAASPLPYTSSTPFGPPGQHLTTGQGYNCVCMDVGLSPLGLLCAIMLHVQIGHHGRSSHRRRRMEGGRSGISQMDR